MWTDPGRGSVHSDTENTPNVYFSVHQTHAFNFKHETLSSRRAWPQTPPHKVCPDGFICLYEFILQHITQERQSDCINCSTSSHIHECWERAMLKGGNSSRYGLKRQFRHLLVNPGSSAIQHRKPKLFSKREQQLCKRFICILSQHKSFKLQEQ